MKLKYLLLLFIYPLAGILCARPKTDVIVMSNGDRLTCEIKKLDRGVLYAGLDYVDGTVSIEWLKVARIESKQLFVVHTQGGSIYEGTLRTAESSTDQPVTIEVVEGKSKDEKLKPAEVVELAQTSGSFWRRVSGNLDSGMIYSKGNDNVQYNFGSEARINRELWKAQASYTSALSKSSGLTASTRNQTKLRALRFIGSNKWFYDGGGELLQSSQQGIRRQVAVGGGIGKFLKDSNRASISLSAGAVWQGTQYEESKGNQSPPNSIGALFATDIHVFRFKKTSLDVAASAIPVLSEMGRVRSYLNTAYSIQIISNLWIKFSFYGNWDNRPPASFSGSDYGSSTSISYSFN